MAIAHLEKIEHPAYRMRIGNDDWEYGQPYELGLVVEDLGNHTASITLLYAPMHPRHWRAARAILVGAGFESVVFERHRLDGTIDFKTVKFKGPSSQASQDEVFGI